MHHVDCRRGRQRAWDQAQPNVGVPVVGTGIIMEIGSDEWSHLLIAGARAFGLELTPAHTRVFEATPQNWSHGTG